MSIAKIKTLSLNPHFYALLMHAFLSGYQNPCRLQYLFMAIPILLHTDTRTKLATANINSTLDTLFPIVNTDSDNNISGKAKFAGFVERYNYLKPYCKQVIIIRGSNNIIAIKNRNITIRYSLDYKKCTGKLKKWTRCAYYLGLIFAKATESHLSFYLGVNTK